MTLKVEPLEQSFALIQSDSERFTATFYQTLFTQYPEVEPLFINADMHHQGKKLFASLKLVVDNLRSPAILSASLEGLGAKHIHYGVLPHHYPMVGTALLQTFEHHLPATWTPDLKQAWADAYAAVAELMLAGADYSPELLEL